MKNQIELSDNYKTAIITVVVAISSTLLLLGLGYFFEDSLKNLILLIPIIVAMILCMIAYNIQDDNVGFKLASISLCSYMIQGMLLLVYFSIYM